jgi:hypothetical protein
MIHPANHKRDLYTTHLHMMNLTHGRSVSPIFGGTAAKQSDESQQAKA